MHDTYKIDKQKLERVPDRLKRDTERKKVIRLFVLETNKKRLGLGGGVK